MDIPPSSAYKTAKGGIHMRTFQRLTLGIAVLSMFCGLAVLAEDPVPLDAKCNPGGQGRGKGPKPRCEPFCGSCQQVVCDGPGGCRWHCEPIPDCVPS